MGYAEDWEVIILFGETKFPLLKNIFLTKEGAIIISIDSIGCQFAIAEKIIAKGGEYFLVLKENQTSLMSDVESMFSAKNTCFPDIFEEHNKRYGKTETRICETLGNIEWLTERHPKKRCQNNQR